jgi:hypothetical protein
MGHDVSLPLHLPQQRVVCACAAVSFRIPRDRLLQGGLNFLGLGMEHAEYAVFLLRSGEFCVAIIAYSGQVKSGLPSTF